MANHPIFAPTFHGDVAKVKRLLQEDATLVAVVDAKNLTPLHVAASRGQAAVAQLLIDYGADVNGGSDEEWSPLVFAAYRGHFDAAEILINNGAGVNKPISTCCFRRAVFEERFFNAFPKFKGAPRASSPEVVPTSLRYRG